MPKQATEDLKPFSTIVSIFNANAIPLPNVILLME